MDPILGGMITGGASLLGSIFSSQTNAANTQAQIAAQQQQLGETEAFNASQADINRQFQAGSMQQALNYDTQMSNTAYQRASADMKAAGLNPMAMFGSGGPASTPSAPTASGSSASVGTPSVPMPTRTAPFGNLADAVVKGMSTAGAVQDLQKQAELTDVAHYQAQEQQANARKAAADATVREREVAGAIGKADRTAREEGYLADLKPAEQRAATQAPYVGKAYGDWGGQLAAPAHTVIQGISNTVKDMVNEATGPTGQALWDKARRMWNAPVPNVRGTTLNSDWSATAQ